MISYILQTIVIQLLFVGIYELILQRETFFQLNRAYLLIGLICSVLIPIIPWSTMVPTANIQVLLPEINLNSLDSNANSNVFHWQNILLGFWIFGMFYTATKFVRNIIHLYRLNQIGTPLKGYSKSVMVIPNSRVAFSFFNTIYIGSQIELQDRVTIIKHEVVHANQNHSFDLVVLEMYKIIFWFNPLVYYYQNRLKRLHEFLADAEVVKSISRKDYYEQLLSQFFGTQRISFINTFFNHLLIQKRIVMLQKSKSNKLKLFNYLLLIPLLLSAVLWVSCVDPASDEVVEEIEVRNLEITTDRSSNPVPFYEIEKVPVYPGCEGLSMEEAKKCFVQQVSQFVVQEFNTKVASEEITGKQRIVVNFSVTKEGHITDVMANADFQELVDEAVRVINKLPQMQPGQNDGKPVAVKFTLPILFDMVE